MITLVLQDMIVRAFLASEPSFNASKTLIRSGDFNTYKNINYRAFYYICTLIDIRISKL